MADKKRNIDLLHGRILPALTGLAVPIMATSMVQTAYNLTDMAWIGRIGSQAVTAVGAAGMYTWLSGGIVTLARMGGQVKVAHSLGEGSPEEAAEYGRGAIQLTIFLALLFALLSNLFTGPMIGFFGLSSPRVLSDAEHYLRIAGGLIIFSFLNQTLTGLFTAIGDSRTPFLANSTGLVINMILDPILIFGIGPFPRMEAVGAATATVIAQLIVTLVMLVRASGDPILFRKLHLFRKTSFAYIRVIFRLGVPSALQSMLYSGISMVLTRMVASWGDSAVAVQRVGGQVECISWMAAEGLGSAMNAFTGQNFGAKFYERMKKGYRAALTMIVAWGTVTSMILVFGGRPIFQIFIQEPEVLPAGIRYLTILGYGQMPMCVELMTAGALQGMGKTMACSAITIVFTAVRIPLAILLSGTSLGLDGIWWALTLTSMAKGVVFTIYYSWTLHNLKAEGGRQER
ncbi:MAG: MATE family efflux transporter [Lachnospiraceae bacterium]|nr:MATE family efflux transporter [Lachnospiraceae bacterium]